MFLDRINESVTASFVLWGRKYEDHPDDIRKRGRRTPTFATMNSTFPEAVWLISSAAFRGFGHSVKTQGLKASKTDVSTSLN
jgi:hypothetical protein